jgi:hypothetical protein
MCQSNGYDGCSSAQDYKGGKAAKEVSQIHHIQSTKTYHIHAQLQKEARAKVAEDKESK